MPKSQQLGLSFSCKSLTLELGRQLSCKILVYYPLIGLLLDFVFQIRGKGSERTTCGWTPSPHHPCSPLVVPDSLWWAVWPGQRQQRNCESFTSEANWIPSKSHRCLSVRVGQNPVNLHFFLVHVVDVHPQVPAHRICWTVGLRRVVVVVRVLLQRGQHKMSPVSLQTTDRAEWNVATFFTPRNLEALWKPQCVQHQWPTLTVFFFFDIEQPVFQQYCFHKPTNSVNIY